MKTLRILGLLGRLWPVARAIIEALDRRSPGGKRITPAERDEILRIGAGMTRDELDRYLEAH